jgi:hypothetical protein
LRLPALAYLRWAWTRFRRRRQDGDGTLPTVRLRTTRYTGGIFQGVGTKPRNIVRDTGTPFTSAEDREAVA